MKAIKIINPGPNSSLTIGEEPKPEPSEDEILVNIKAAALNRADLSQRAGNYPPPEDASEILGLEMAGVVENVGSNEFRWKSGDRVFGLLPGGGYAQYCVMPEKMAMPVPDNLSFEEAAAIPEAFLTTWQTLKWTGNIKKVEEVEVGFTGFESGENPPQKSKEQMKGQTVLIHAGGSGVGTAAIQIARQMFDALIITTAGEERKLETCKKLGADYAINYHEQNFAEVIADKLGENAVDLIIDFIGEPYWKQNIEVLNTDGRLIYLSFLGGHILHQMSLAPILKKRLKIMGSTLRSRSVDYKIKLTQSFLMNVLPLLEKGDIKPVIDRTFNWKDTEEAHQYMADNKNTGKIVLKGM